ARRREVGAESYLAGIGQLGPDALRGSAEPGMRLFHTCHAYGGPCLVHVLDLRRPDLRLTVAREHRPDVLHAVEVDWKVVLPEQEIELVPGTLEPQRAPLKIAPDELVHAERMEDAFQHTCRRHFGIPDLHGPRPSRALSIASRVV